MQIDVISDFEVDVIGLSKSLEILPKKSRTLIIAGDICSKYTTDIFNVVIAFLTSCCSIYDSVIYVIGNRDLYTYDAKQDIELIVSKIVALQSILIKLKILEKDYIVLKYEKIIVYGGTMLSKASEDTFPSNLPMYSSRDEVGTYTTRNITHSDWCMDHYSFRKGLEHAINISRQLDYNLVVVSHYSPVISESLEQKYHNHRGNDMYCTDMSKYFGSINTWIFGHTGFNCDIVRNKCHIFSNQYGVKNGPLYKSEAFFI